MSSKIMINSRELNTLINAGNVAVVDVRDVEEYAKGHIPGAVNIPELFYELTMTSDEGLREMTEKFTKLFSEAGVSRDKKVVVYEDNLNTRYGGSCRAYFQLSYLGHEDVSILDGGLASWREAQLPLSTAKESPMAAVFTPKINNTILVNKKVMIDALSDSSIKLLDNRDKVEWIGESSSPYGVDFAPRKGRIPGAVWLEWYNFMEKGQDGSASHFKSPQAIREMCAQLDLHPDDDIIIYCFKGARASNTFVALKIAGFKNVRNYYGSWNEWSRDMSLPIDDNVLAA